jgi:hypothetical protein
MSGLTQSGELPVGIIVAGEQGDVRHRAFTLKPARVIDSIAAIDEVGSHNPIAIGAAILSRQLTQVGTLPLKNIDYALVCDMDPRDYNALEAAAGELAKKALPEPSLPKPGLEPG